MKQQFPFFKTPKNKSELTRAIRDLQNKPASHWEKMGEKMAGDTFAFAAKTVPAYQALLKKNHIAMTRLKNIDDLKKLPVISKPSFLRPAVYEKLFPNKDFSKITTISATSGSTGEPFYFPRLEENDSYYQFSSALALVNQWDLEHKKTLAIIGFGLGIWIGGIFTYKCFNAIARQGYDLSLVPVGPNIDLFLKTVKKFGTDYDQVILMGYAPFIKDVVDQSKDYEVNWKKMNVRVLTAAEGYSEKFKEYVAEKLSMKNPLTDFINIYGTVELGTMAQETPLSNLIRREAAKNKKVFDVLFPGAGHLPTFGQFHPYLHYFEEEKGELLGTGYGTAMPLVRYSFPDRGGVHRFEEVLKKLKKVGFDVVREAKKAGIEKTIFKLPFVYVIERADSSLVFRGANIYAEEVKEALLHESVVSFLSGKFTMKKEEDRKLGQEFHIHVELSPGHGKDKMLGLEEKLQKVIVEYLVKKNSEYADQHKSVGEKAYPKISLWDYQAHDYFKAGGKQRWKID